MTRVGPVHPLAEVVVLVAATHQPARLPTRRGGRGLDAGSEELGAQQPGRVARDGAQLAAQRLVQPLQLAQRRALVATVGVLPGQDEVRLLVDGVRAQQVLPATGQPEKVLVQGRQRVPGGSRPGLVRVIGEQRAAVRRECRFGVGRGAGRDGDLPQAAEDDRVDRDIVVGEEQDLVVAQLQRALAVTEGPARVVRRLVQPGTSRLDADARPERVHDLLAVHPARVGQGQQLHQ